jgi:hypothetical protein
VESARAGLSRRSWSVIAIFMALCNVKGGNVAQTVGEEQASVINY